MIVRVDRPSPVLPGDFVLRPKTSGFGFHYCIGVREGYVAGIAKHVGTLDEFGDRKAATIKASPD